MNPELLSRLLWAVALIALGLSVYGSLNRYLLSRSRFHRIGLEQVEQGRPILLYFTTPTCMPCKTVQRPDILRLKETLGEAFQVVEIDAAARPEVASQWGVMSVPTTFVIDSDGQARYVNHGVARFEKLSRQLANL